jgi:hypothetical protein
MVIFLRMRSPARLSRVIAALVATVALAACGPVDPSPRSSSPSLRCMDEPDRGSSGVQRPLFFVFCAQSP